MWAPSVAVGVYLPGRLAGCLGLSAKYLAQTKQKGPVKLSKGLFTKDPEDLLTSIPMICYTLQTNKDCR